MYCIYCGSDHEEGVQFTDEHVVPYALGGADALKIRVCRDLNNSLGGLVDKPFIEMFPVRAHRFFLGLCGTDGTEPTLDLGGESLIQGQKVRVAYTITKDSRELKIADPSVTKTPTPDGEHWTVFGDPEKVRKILEGKLKSLSAKSKQMRNEAGEVLDSEGLAAVLSSAKREHVNPSVVKTVTADLPACRRFFAKMALAAGHLVLGESFSKSVGADTLRKALRGNSLETTEIPRAHTWPQTGGSEQVLSAFRMKDSHILGVLHGEPPIFVACLFETYDAFIPLGPVGTGRSPRPAQGGRIFQIELPSRRLRDHDLSDYLLAWLEAQRKRKNEV